MDNMTTTQIITYVNSFYSREMLIRAQPLLVHTNFADIRDIPMNNSMTIKFRRYANLPVAKTPLTEGVTPQGSQMAKTDLFVTLEQYGDYLVLTDKLTMTTEDPVRLEASEELSDQFADTIDQLCRDEIVTGTSVVYASTAVSRITVAAGMVLTQTLIEQVEESLKLNKARYITEFVDPTDKINTTPLPPSFWAIIHTNITRTVRAFSGFLKVEQYSNPETRMVGEIGKVSNTRFIETVNAKIFTGAGAAGIDVYATLVMAKYAYAISRLAGNAVENIAHAAGSGGSSDPLNQRETVGWKATFAAIILNDDFIFRIEHAKV